MSARGGAPIEVIGEVKIYDKDSKGYYRLKWTEPDGAAGDTSGRTTIEYARAKATEINDRLTMAAGPLATLMLVEIVADFIAQGCSPYRNKASWKPAQLNNVTKALARCLREITHERAMDVDRRLLDAMRAHAGTNSMVRTNTSVLRSFLTWGEQNGYFTGIQAELLPERCTMPAPRIKREMTWVGGAEPTEHVRMNGQHQDYIGEEDAPSRAQVVALRKALAEALPAWGALAPELAANTGMRWGEQFQITAHDVHLDGCTKFKDPHIHVDWQINSGKAGTGKKGRRVLPKGDKSRVVPVPKKSFTGWSLRKKVRARQEAALVEQTAGTNPDALLFPATGGGMLWYTSFNADFLLPGMVAAGWPVEIWREDTQRWDEEALTYRDVSNEQRRAGLPWHSMRHRFARVCVDDMNLREGVLMAIGGWENIATVQTRYYRSGEENMAAGLAAFA